ncbi:MAG TPA: NADH-quinone oxidoreductase subunit K [Opitutus sp.]|nr:NADH-quinone oxidoreductase subunit K [Opitutus sp.]
MPLETALLAGLLFGFACYLFLQRSFVRILFGFVLLGQAANIAVLAMSGAPDGKGSPIVGGAGGPMVDPLPQALILTAIVIGLGVNSYLVVLMYRIFLDERTTRVDRTFRPRGPKPERS